MTEFETPHRSQRIGYGRTLHFVMARWLREPRDLSRTLMGVAVATACDVMMPVAAGWLISAIAPIGHSMSADRAASLHAAIWAVSAMAILGLLSVVGRRSMYVGITKLSTRVMRSVLTEGFDRVQHFSTDWHANTFAGSTVRRLTRGMWALDTVDDVLLLALLPQILVLGGTAGVLTCRDPLMGAILVISILLFVALSIALTIFYVSPTSRVSNQWDSRVGAAIADAITCNATVKSFGAEVREKLRLHHVMEMWQQRTRKSWIRGTDSGNLQALASLLMRLGLIAIVTWRWWEGRADAGQVAYVLTMVFLIQGYLRDLGNQVSQLQRGVNEMEEMVAIFDHETDVADTAHARDIDIHRGGIRFDKVTFVYPGTTRSLFTDFSVSIEGGRAWRWWGEAAPASPVLSNCCNDSTTLKGAASPLTVWTCVISAFPRCAVKSPSYRRTPHYFIAHWRKILLTGIRPPPWPILSARRSRPMPMISSPIFPRGIRRWSVNVASNSLAGNVSVSPLPGPSSPMRRL
ncbi:hypothetical protein CGLAMM_04540 [Acetobacteraceae bacterium EV16G]|uniref:ABC transmembrane type-1 domain-containing protein n=1 Tax=Sorlinia euscelidii TaxID=3081148 RepID=A0ABU7U099_9PROT